MRTRTRAAKSSESPLSPLASSSSGGRQMATRSAARNGRSCLMLRDLLGNQKETGCKENHHAREEDEPHEQAHAKVQSDRGEAPHLPRAAWPDEKQVADLHHQRAPAC